MHVVCVRSVCVHTCCVYRWYVHGVCVCMVCVCVYVECVPGIGACIHGVCALGGCVYVVCALGGCVYVVCVVPVCTMYQLPLCPTRPSDTLRREGPEGAVGATDLGSGRTTVDPFSTRRPSPWGSCALLTAALSLQDGDSQ